MSTGSSWGASRVELLGPVYRTQHRPVMSACGEEGGGVTSTCRTARIIVFIGASFQGGNHSVRSCTLTQHSMTGHSDSDTVPTRDIHCIFHLEHTADSHHKRHTCTCPCKLQHKHRHSPVTTGAPHRGRRSLGVNALISRITGGK